MTDKERFHALMSFEPSDRLLYWEQGFWRGTVERWYREGLPKVHGIEGNPAYGDTIRGPATPVKPEDVVCSDILEAAGLDKPSLMVPVNLLFCPPFEEEGDWLIVRGEYGIVKKVTRGRDSIPNFISWPMSTHEDLERLVEERLNPDTPERSPPDWVDQLNRLREYDGVIGLGGYVWEDTSYKNGPLISSEMFKEFLVPA